MGRKIYKFFSDGFYFLIINNILKVMFNSYLRKVCCALGCVWLLADLWEAWGVENGGLLLGVDCQVKLGVGSRDSWAVGTSRRKIWGPFLGPLGLPHFLRRGG